MSHTVNSNALRSFTPRSVFVSFTLIFTTILVGSLVFFIKAKHIVNDEFYTRLILATAISLVMTAYFLTFAAMTQFFAKSRYFIMVISLALFGVVLWMSLESVVGLTNSISLLIFYKPLVYAVTLLAIISLLNSFKASLRDFVLVAGLFIIFYLSLESFFLSSKNAWYEPISNFVNTLKYWKLVSVISFGASAYLLIISAKNLVVQYKE